MARRRHLSGILPPTRRRTLILQRGAGLAAKTPPPVLLSLLPAIGSSAGGTPVTLTGSGFQAGATVTFGGSAATSVTVVNSTSITCVTPAHAVATVNVTVANPDGQSSTLVNGYSYIYTGIIPDIVGAAVVSHVVIAGGVWAERKSPVWTQTTGGGLTYNASAPIGFAGGAAAESLQGFSNNPVPRASSPFTGLTSFVITAIIKTTVTADQGVFSISDTIGNPMCCLFPYYLGGAYLVGEYNTTFAVLGPANYVPTNTAVVISMAVDTPAKRVTIQANALAQQTGVYGVAPTNAAATIYIGNRGPNMGAPLSGKFYESSIQVVSNPASYLAAINAAVMAHT